MREELPVGVQQPTAITLPSPAAAIQPVVVSTTMGGNSHNNNAFANPVITNNSGGGGGNAPPLLPHTEFLIDLTDEPNDSEDELSAVSVSVSEGGNKVNAPLTAAATTTTSCVTASSSSQSQLVGTTCTIVHSTSNPPPTVSPTDDTTTTDSNAKRTRRRSAVALFSRVRNGAVKRRTKEDGDVDDDHCVKEEVEEKSVRGGSDLPLSKSKDDNPSPAISGDDSRKEVAASPAAAVDVASSLSSPSRPNGTEQDNRSKSPLVGGPDSTEPPPNDDTQEQTPAQTTTTVSPTSAEPPAQSNDDDVEWKLDLLADLAKSAPGIGEEEEEDQEQEEASLEGQHSPPVQLTVDGDQEEGHRQESTAAVELNDTGEPLTDK